MQREEFSVLKGVWIAVCLLLVSTTVFADQKVTSTYTITPPVLDGGGDDAAWKSAPTTTTKDSIAGISIEIQSVYTDTNIFMKVRFPDSSENRKHKVLEWDKANGLYRTGSLREDSFVFKWSMEPVPVNLSLQSGVEYRADVWFWKAFRTDPVEFADDKIHIYSSVKGKKSQDILLENGEIMFLSRTSDDGKSTYKSIAYEKYIGATVPRYEHRMPTGSRADVLAKGHWADGFWTIEFKRALETGHQDDIQFRTSSSILFGVSKFEIGGKAPNPNLEQPNYESGDITEMLELVFIK
ncbi:MAG: hypothetical protein GY799_11645 [Desulfobulbaceae bacterium]|nr:hypothetical protein [Desulfobulbaceae bacterium]